MTIELQTSTPVFIPDQSVYSTKVDFALPYWSTQLVLFTPDLCETQLRDHNSKNRSLSESRAKMYARDQQAKKFFLSPDCIAYDTQRRVRSGQHRMRACVISGEPFLARVVVNQPEPICRNLDTHRSRSFSDLLQLEGTKNAKTAAAMAVVLEFMESDHTTLQSSAMNEKALIYERYGVDILKIIEIVKPSKNYAFSPVMGAIAFVHHILPEVAQRFAEAYATGAGLEVTDPPYALRSHVNGLRNLSSQADRTLAILHTLGAIRAYVNGDKMTKMYPVKDISHNKSLSIQFLNEYAQATANPLGKA